MGYPITLDATPLKGATTLFGLVGVREELRTSESPQTRKRGQAEFSAREESGL